MPEPLPEDFDAALRASAARRGAFGEPSIFFSETGSTNDVAAALAERGAREGTTVLALAQRAGRGRLGREWFSPAGAGLYVSVICRNRRAAPMITLAGGVAVATGIRAATGLPVLIKWPNDIVVPDRSAPGRRRKAAGILAEASSNADGVQFVVLGIGVNLRPAAYPPVLAGRATSLEAELGRPVDGGAVLAEILASLNEQIAALTSGEQDRVLRQWRELSPSATGAQVEWRTNSDARRGVTAGIDDTGALLVRVGDQVERIIAGEVIWD